MNLSTLIGSANPYLEYGWVTAPNTAGQSITNNTITTLTVNTEVADTGNFGSIASNQITLAAGTYYYKATVQCDVGNATFGGAFSLYNITASRYVSTTGPITGGVSYANAFVLEGQMTITSSSVFDLRMLSAQSGMLIKTAGYASNFTNSTSGADQRTTIKLWKLA
jgi:hypothetical protein